MKPTTTTPFALTRRQCVSGLLAVPALGFQAVGRTFELANDSLKFAVVVRDGRLVARRFVNRLANETVELPPQDFVLEFDAGAAAGSADFRVEASRPADNAIELLYAGVAGELSGHEVRVRYELPEGKAYLRKSISVRRTGSPARRLMRVDLENWRGVRREWRSMGAVDYLPHGSHPIYCDTLWAGVEFVAAFNTYGRDGFVLRSRPGGKPVGSDWVALHSTVVGAARPLRVREAFLAYIDDVRLAPARLVACYNTWWTFYAKDLSGERLLTLVRELKEKLYDKHGVFFDVVTADEGWTERRSIWRIDRNKFPGGFAPVREVVESAGGKLGLWMSPSAVYPNSTDYEWAAESGYFVNEYDYLRTRRRPGISLADPKYRRETKRQLQKLIREEGLHQVKYDGFIAMESKPHHGLLPGKDSVEPLAHYSFELLEASREAAPDLVTEPTYLNSHRNYISPWIIRYADFIWGNSGGDCPLGFTPAPDYREAHTTAREYYIFSSLNEVWLPQNALQYFDIVHADEDAGFPNHAAMAFGRGRFFVPTYVNPRYMSDEDWRIYAGLLRWARKNREILRHTHITPSRVEEGEPYVYAHWRGRRGILVVRNPSNETKEFELDLERERAPAGLSDAVCYTQYPYRKGIAAGLNAASRIALTLAPWELLFLEIAPRAELAEPVALGARWWRGRGGGMEVTPGPGVEKVRIMEPRAGEKDLAVKPRPARCIAGEVTSVARRRLPESAWLEEGGKRAPTVEFELECSITVPEGPCRGQALLLVKFPGRRHRPNTCKALVNGRPAALEESSSAGRVGNWVGSEKRWSGALPYFCHWSWHICDLQPGTSQVKFTAAAAGPDCEIGLWAWLEEDVRAGAAPAGIECPEPQMPEYRADVERGGICLRRPA